VRLDERPAAGAPQVRLSPEVFTQLLFGFRPAWWAAEQVGQVAPETLLPVLAALFPLEATWVAGSDAF
jgi:hypothetical protein